MNEILEKHNIPERFHPALVKYAETGRLVGAELKSCVRTLKNFELCAAELRGDVPNFKFTGVAVSDQPSVPSENHD